VATHPEDDLILATAIARGASYLVTGDRKLRAVGAFQEVILLSPRDFHELLLAGSEGKQ
jgi:predicted nucleic acid-binding protein